MRFQTPKSMLLSLSLLSVLPAALLLTPLRAEIACTGHKLLSNPRPESSCSNVKPVSYASPDGCAARCRSSCRCQPLCHSGHGKPRRDSYQQGRHAHVEGLFIAARHQWILRCPVLRLQHVVVGRSFALVISADGVQPPEKSHSRTQRHDRRQADGFGRLPLQRTAYARCQHVDAAWSLGG